MMSQDEYGGNSGFIVNIIMINIVVIIIAAIVYIYYTINLDSTECKKSDSMYSVANTYIHSTNSNDPDCQYTLKDYYIKTAYNCCSGGSYRNDFVDTCNLKNIIKQGVRALDFEIYSIDDKPVVATSTESNYNIKETYNSVPFSDVMSVIVNYAFSNGTAPCPDDPIVIHLRIKSSNQNMFNTLAAIFRENSWRLLGPEYGSENRVCDNSTDVCHSRNIGDLKLQDELKGKIVVVVDRSNTDFMDNTEFYPYVNMTSNSMFMRCMSYYDTKFTPDMGELQEYNKKNMSIVIPDNKSNPENPSGIVCREMGCQMIAMRYENMEINLEENEQFFNSVGYSFVLKPERLRYIPIIIPDTPENDPLLAYAPRETKSDYYNFQT